MQTHIPIDLFVSFFRPCIRVLLDWDRLQNESCPIRLSVLDDLAVISSWYLPWNFDAGGKEVKYNLPSAHPIQLSSVSQLILAFDEKRRQKILDIAEFFGDSHHPTRPAQFVVPTYALSNESYIVLDGSHRMAALVLAKIPFRLLVFSIHGPVSNAIMPELRHWEQSPQIRQWE